MELIQKGTANFWKVNIALFIGGFVTFTVLYNIQPLLPIYSHEFRLSPAVASLALSVTTGTLAISLMFAASISNSRGRKPIMTFSLFASALLTLLTAWSPNFLMLLVCRALEGIVVAGLPAIAMTYLGEEVHPLSLGLAMGIYIGGNAIGGMTGRIATGLLTDFYSWRIALEVEGVAGILCALWFWRFLPPSKNFKPQPFRSLRPGLKLLEPLSDPGLLCMYGLAFLLMGGFVTLYNYIGYQLTEPPYNLSQALVSWIFIVYILGTVSSAWMGQLADRFARYKVLSAAIAIMLVGVLISLNGNIYLKVLAIAICTAGFFGGHSIASSWVGKRARSAKAQASALYLFSYYIGSSVGGSVGGLFWSYDGWAGVVLMVSSFLVLSFGLTARLALLPAVDTPCEIKQLLG